MNTSLCKLQKILSLIAMKPAEDFDGFLEALKNSGQTNLSSRIKTEKESFTGKYNVLQIYTGIYNKYKKVFRIQGNYQCKKQ